MSEIEAISSALFYCNLGYDNYTASCYERVIEFLTPFVGNKHIDDAVRLAGGGKNLSSPRFVYPHIMDSLRGRLKELANVA